MCHRGSIAVNPPSPLCHNRLASPLFPAHTTRPMGGLLNMKRFMPCIHTYQLVFRVIEEVVTQAFLSADEEFLTTALKPSSGSTATTAMVLGDRFYGFNVGDSRTILCRAGRAEVVSKVRFTFRGRESRKTRKITTHQALFPLLYVCVLCVVCCVGVCVCVCLAIPFMLDATVPVNRSVLVGSSGRVVHTAGRSHTHTYTHKDSGIFFGIYFFIVTNQNQKQMRG